MRGCPECGFDFDVAGTGDVGARVLAAARSIAEILVTTDDDIATRRPRPERWSAVEYAAHARDVMLIIRDRLVVGLVEKEPGFTPAYRDERVALGLYAADTAAAVAPEVVAAATMLDRLFHAIPADALARTVMYGHPGPERRTLGWMGLQAVHESEHHLLDIRTNHTLLRGR